jgi:hypothetical protein
LLHRFEDALPLPELVNAVRAAAKALRNGALRAAEQRKLVSFLLVRRARGDYEIAQHSLHDFARRRGLDRDESLRGGELGLAQRRGALLRSKNAAAVVRVDVQRVLLRGLELRGGRRAPDDVRGERTKRKCGGFAGEEELDGVATRARDAQLARVEPAVPEAGARDLNDALARRLDRRRRRRGCCVRRPEALCILTIESAFRRRVGRKVSRALAVVLAVAAEQSVERVRRRNARASRSDG